MPSKATLLEETLKIKSKFIGSLKKISAGIRTRDFAQLSPEQDSVADLLVEVVAVGLERQQVLELGHVAQVRVDPVGKGSLLLAEDHVVAVAVLT